MTRAFLIGAGATRAQYPAAPLSTDFMAKLKTMEEPLFTHIKKTIDAHIGPNEIENLDLEILMKMSYTFPLSVKDDLIESLHLAIYKLLRETTGIGGGGISHSINNRKNEPPTRFKRLLTDNRLNSKDFFMTLNYDLDLDCEIIRMQNSIDYGIPTNMISNREGGINPNNNQEFSLYHLHGSLNWYRINDSSIVLTNSPFTPEVKRSGSNVCIVPPGRKELNHVLKSVWESSLSRLIKADELIIIGCSLNPQDSELINLIKSFVKKNGTNKVKIIYVGNDSKSKSNYEEVLGGGFVTYPYGFNISGPKGQKGAIEFIFESKN